MPTSCPLCKDSRYLVERQGERAVAKVCGCNETCSACDGTGRQMVEDKGYTFVKPCACQSVRQRVAVFNQARIPARAGGFTFENFVPESEEQVRARSVAETTAKMYRPGLPSKGFILAGDVGTGKTHLLCATLRHLTLELGIPSRYVEFSFLMAEIKAGFERGRSSLDIIAPLVGLPILAIDEIGKGRGTPFEMDTLDELIARRYNTQSTTLFATNLSLEKHVRGRIDDRGMRDPLEHDSMMQRLLVTKVGERIYSRLFEMCHAIAYPPGSVKDHRKGDRASLVGN